MGDVQYETSLAWAGTGPPTRCQPEGSRCHSPFNRLLGVFTLYKTITFCTPHVTHYVRPVLNHTLCCCVQVLVSFFMP